MTLKEGRFHLLLLRRGRDLQRQLLLQLRPQEIGTLPRMLHLFEALHLLLYSIHRLDRIHPIEVNHRHVQNRHLRVDHQPNGTRILIYLRVCGSLAMGHPETGGSQAAWIMETATTSTSGSSSRFSF